MGSKKFSLYESDTWKDNFEIVFRDKTYGKIRINTKIDMDVFIALLESVYKLKYSTVEGS